MGEHRRGNVIYDDFGRQIALIQNGKRIAVKGQTGVRPIKSRIKKSKPIPHAEIKRRAQKQKGWLRQLLEARKKALQ